MLIIDTQYVTNIQWIHNNNRCAIDALRDALSPTMALVFL